MERLNMEPAGCKPKFSSIFPSHTFFHTLPLLDRQRELGIPLQSGKALSAITKKISTPLHKCLYPAPAVSSRLFPNSADLVKRRLLNRLTCIPCYCPYPHHPIHNHTSGNAELTKLQRYHQSWFLHFTAVAFLR